MAEYSIELDLPTNIVIVTIIEEDGSEDEYQIDFDPRSGRWAFDERDDLEEERGEEWVGALEDAVDGIIRQGLDL